MSQKSVTVNETPSPEAVAAQQQAEQKALEASKNVTITTTDRDAAGNKVVTDVQQGQPAESLILGKFKTQDDLIAAYKALETKLGQQKPAEPAAQPAAQQPPTQQKQNDLPQGETPAQQKAIQAAAAEYAEKHELSDETYITLEKVGIPRSIAKNYVAGIQAQEALIEQNVFAVTGDEKGYNAMVDWAASNLTEGEIAAFDKAVTDGSPAEMKAAVEGLWARYKVSAGFEPGSITQGGNSTAPKGSGEMFRSRHEMQAAMNDPRYRAGDLAYHAEVQQKMANALAAGVQLFS